MALAVRNSIPFPRSSRRADTSVPLAVTRPDILRRKFRERGNTPSYQPFAGLPQKAFLAQEMQTLPQVQEFGVRHDRRTFSSTTRARWKSFLEKNIGWIVVAGSIWLTHFLR